MRSSLGWPAINFVIRREAQDFLPIVLPISIRIKKKLVSSEKDLVYNAFNENQPFQLSMFITAGNDKERFCISSSFSGSSESGAPSLPAPLLASLPEN